MMRKERGDVKTGIKCRWTGIVPGQKGSYLKEIK
jgi:hypothetical protein